MQQRTILVVDDEEDIRDSLQDALSEEGYAVVVASNGREALRLLPEIPKPCAVILDIIMPVMSGTEVYAAMLASPALADIPVLVSTSDPSAAPRHLPIVRKPVNLDRFLMVVASLFRPTPSAICPGHPL